jgi:hypothetical protein
MVHITTPSQQTPAPTWRARTLLPMLRIATFVVVPAPAWLLSGCIILDGTSPGSGSGSGSSMSAGSSNGSSMDMSNPSLDPLPPPDIWRLELPIFNAGQQMRYDEGQLYLAKLYQDLGWKIVATTQGGLTGDIFDWLDPASVKGSDAEPPPLPTPEELQLPDGVSLSLTELDMFPGPEGLIPVVRPGFAAYVLGDSGASSLEDFLTNYVVPGVPGGPNRLYAGVASATPNLGATTHINSFGGLIQPGTTSLLEMVVGCRDPNNPVNGQMWQQVGIAASRDWATQGFQEFGAGTTLRVRVEFLTAGDATGPNKGGWVGTYAGFVPAAGARNAPNEAISTPSTVGGPQFEHLYDIRLWNGNWWVGWNGTWLGYYPGSLFNQISSQACEVDWYGEVYDKDPAIWTWTDMGSGQFANAGFGQAANFRNPNYIDPSGIPQWPAKIGDVSPRNDACYTRTDLATLPSPWDLFFYVGGPGADSLPGFPGSPNCK